MQANAINLWMTLLLMLPTYSAQGKSPATNPSIATKTVVIELQGEINDYTRDDLFRRFREAKELGAKVVILEVNTYGGLVTSALDISRFIKQQNDIQVVAFVRQKAISAGSMISVACDELYMAPHSLLGDSAPIAVAPGGNGLQTLGETERAKAESPILEDFRDSAKKNGYDPLLVESMVALGREVHFIQNKQGERKFVDEPTYKELTAKGEWSPVPDVRNPIDAKDSLLTVNAELAKKIGLAKEIVATPDDLANMRGWEIIARFSPTAGDHLIAFLASDTVRFFLFTVLSISIYVALHAPGHGFPEAIAAICLGLLLGVPLLTGYAQWWEIVAILLGMVLLAMEIFVIPGFGVAGISGIILIIFGLLMTFVPKEPSGPGMLPSLSGTWDALGRGLFIIVGGTACTIFVAFWINRFLPRIPYFNRLILTATSGGTSPSPAASDTTKSPAQPAEAWPGVGAIGLAITELKPGGTASFTDPNLGDSRVIDAISDMGFVPANTKIVVREMRNNYVIVRAVPAS